jgi:hypothetical protein
LNYTFSLTTNKSDFCRDWDSHRGGYEGFYIFGYNTMLKLN